MEKHSNLNFFKNIFWISFSTIATRAFTFISSIITARILLPEDFGIISMAATISGFIDVISRLGIGVFIVSNQNLSKKDINSIHILNMVLGLCFGIIMIAGGSIASIIYKTPEIKNILFFSGLTYFVSSLYSVPRALLFRDLRQYIVSKIEILQSFLNVVLIIIMALNGFKYLSFIIPQFVTTSIIGLVYFYLVKFKISKEINKDIIIQAFNYGKSFMPKTFLHYLMYNSDYIFVGYFLGSRLLGYYFFGFDKALIAVYLLINITCNTFLPLFSKIQSDKVHLKNTVFSLIEKQTFIIYPIVFMQILLAKEFIQIIYSNKWNNSILTFSLISAYSFVYIVASIFHVLFDAVGRPDQNLKHFQIVAPIGVLGLFIGTKLGGLTGVSIAAFIVHFFSVFPLFFRVSKFFEWSFKDILASSFKAFIPILVQIPIILPLKIYLNYINSPNYITTLIVLPIYFTLYLIFAKLFLRDIFDSIIDIVKQKFIEKFNTKDLLYEKS